MAALEGLLGEGIVVRSDDVDGNDVSGVVARGATEQRFAARFTDDGEVVECQLDP